MKRSSHNAGATALSPTGNNALETRIFRSMAGATVVAVLASVPFLQWRITAGLLLGGILSLLNHHWLSTSTTAAFKVVAHGAKPKLSLLQYVLRYLVIAVAVFVAYKLKLVSLGATIAGLCSFVVALFVEALREFYLLIVHREETS
jgi:ATP synthase I chain